MDPAAAGLASDHDAIGLVERAPGLNEAIVAARSVAVARGATAVIVVPADLPAITPLAVDSLVEAAALATSGSGAAGIGGVAIVPDRAKAGTNALLVSPPALIEPAFGPGSYAMHRDAAEDAGAVVVEVDGPLSLDVDTTDDLLAAEAELGVFRG
jgi:2-phospho-L-lactate guanylyltransferase